MNETLRTFIAISLSPTVLDKLHDIQTQLKKSGADVTWVKKNNIHLTLKFLGETPIKKIKGINRVIQSIADHQPPCSFKLKNIGAFPTIHHPQIIWIGVEASDQANIIQLAKSLEEGLEPLGFKKETRPFAVHITLGRTKSGLNQLALVKILKQLEIREEIRQAVTFLTFYKSTLTAQGPVYEAISKTQLKESNLSDAELSNA